MGRTISGVMDDKSIQEKLLCRCIPEPNSGCWLWTAGTKGRAGNEYPTIYWNGVYYAAHRLSHAAFRGDVHGSLDVCHTCDNTYCINPEHLFLGTARDNIRDMLAKGRANRKGEAHTGWRGTVLNEQIVIEIRSSTRPTRTLARDLGFSRSAVRLARFGKSWRHLNDLYPPQKVGGA